ncbi:MAG: hypothetical protein H6857_02755 [Rhodospirillales bacterium]|nr:hypothetical protein [Rhodospirillales bacterium]MCB9973705.1 hypothetical protein [Rhodospirillales bacterium]MCB9979991.1 hypothetical protein [Rhodospirillales bacterium]
MRISVLALTFLLVAPMWSLPSRAEEPNRGLSLSKIFKINKAQESDTTGAPEEAPSQNEEDQSGIVLTGGAGPRMPAVPPGDIKKEIIIDAKASVGDQSGSDVEVAPPLVPLVFNPKIPFATLFFQNGHQQSLETAHRQLIELTVQKVKQGHYDGKIRIQSYSDAGHQTAMERAQKIRSLLILYGITPANLEVQALPGLKKDNLIHIFLLGDPA